MLRKAKSWLKHAAFGAGVVLAVVLALRAWQSQRGPDLAPWHTWAPHELHAGDIDAQDWKAWIGAEDALFTEVDEHMKEALTDRERVPTDRYFDGSPLYPAHFAQNWNRSYTIVPAGELAGAVVLLHGLTDSPYSLRHVAQIYAAHGYAAVGIRMPGHGTVPAGLSDARWEDWTAATRLAVRTALTLAGPGKPLHIVGYSNGGALALEYALETLEDPALQRPTRLVLLSPMIGVSGFARYAGIAGWPAALPRFAKAGWLDLLPEYNPFKYNSFPVNAARQSYQVTQVVSERMLAAASAGKLAQLPTVLVFQSVVDSTVNASAVFTVLLSQLPANGSEVVLFDVNRSATLQTLLTSSSLASASQLVPQGAQRYRVTILGNSRDSDAVTERSVPPGKTRQTVRPLGLIYPRNFLSLSHIALPFPVSDSLYGTEPDNENYGLHLGNQLLRGERSVLIIGSDAVSRTSCNPFFPYVAERITEGLRVSVSKEN